MVAFVPKKKKKKYKETNCKLIGSCTIMESNDKLME